MSSYKHAGKNPFRLAISIEKEFWAHQTLMTRAAFRKTRRGRRNEFLNQLASAGVNGAVAGFPEQFKLAASEAILGELGILSRLHFGDLIRARISKGEESVLIGGPPCQAYSLVGRARNKGIKGYDLDGDARHSLYERYLEVLSDHRPVAFVMENVMGLLSASTKAGRLFERITSDLAAPGRSLGQNSPLRYNLHALCVETSSYPSKPSDYIVRSEDLGVPQRRHRLVIIGLREDLGNVKLKPLDRLPPISTGEAIGDLPKLRSGQSESIDTLDKWRMAVLSAKNSSWFRKLGHSDPDVAIAVKSAMDTLSSAGRGAEAMKRTRQPSKWAKWCLADEGGVVFNHSARSHMTSDLHRYLFVASYGQVRHQSPDLSNFPEKLLPLHVNASQAIASGALFKDRFRVQLRDFPATTITSHISKDGHYYIHYDPTQCRSLTVREAARLQSFPDSYFFCGPRTAQYIQVGNAVPPLLASIIAKSVSAALRAAGVPGM